MDELQMFRMTVPWPLITGAAAFLLARGVFWFVDGRLVREHGLACAIVGVAGGVVGLSIAIAWDDGTLYWVGFTAGLAVLALVLLMTCVQLLVEMWRNG